MTMFYRTLYKKAVCLLTLMCVTLAAAAGLSMRTAAQPDTETVRVGYYENEVFQEGAAENAVKTGYAYEYYRKISEYTGWSYEYVYGDFTEMYEKLLNGEIDLLAGLAFREDRAGLYTYTFTDMLRDNFLLFAGIAVVMIAVVILFLVRDSARSKSQAADRERARIALEEKNRELARVAQDAKDADTAQVIPDFMYRTDCIDAAAGLKHCGSADAYMDAVRTFLDTAEGNIAEIERFRRENDIRSLTIKIHALKSTARIIGAEKLGAFAETLEKAGNANDTVTLESGVDALLSDYRALAAALAPAKQTAAREKPVISGEKLKEAYGTILEFSEALDYDSIEYMIKSLDGYTVPDSEAERFEKLKLAALNFDYDLIPEILE